VGLPITGEGVQTEIIKIPDADFTSGISFSGVSEHIHLHGLDRFPLSVNDQSHFLGGFPAENLFSATRTNLRRDVFHKNRFPVNLKDLTHELCAEFR